MVCKENWDEFSHELEDFLTTVRSEKKMEDDGLDPDLEKTFYDLIVKELYDKKEPTDKIRKLSHGYFEIKLLCWKVSLRKLVLVPATANGKANTNNLLFTDW